MAIMSIADALKAAIAEEMRRDPTVYCLGEDEDIPGGMGGAFTVTKGLGDEFGANVRVPEKNGGYVTKGEDLENVRVINTPISEILISGVCVGSAMNGMRPVADLQYGDFLFCMMDQLVNQAAKMCYMSGGKVHVPMVMRAPCGATNRGAQHAQSLESYFIHCPGLKVICPSTAYDAKGLMKQAIRDDNPVIVFEHKLLYAPGKAANAGGVATSGLEMTQNSMRITWSPEEVDAKLRSIMQNIPSVCVQYGTQADGYINYVNGANIGGFMKVAKSMVEQGIL